MKKLECLLVCLALVLGGVSTASAGVLRAVAISGSNAPGTGQDFSSLFGVPVLNNAGQTAFRGLLSQPEINDSNGYGIWSEGAGSLALVAIAGNEAPGTDVKFSHFGNPLLNRAGRIAFIGFLTGSEGSDNIDRGIWSQKGGELALVARDGNRAPGTTTNFSEFYSSHGYGSLVFNSEGQTSFSSYLTGLGESKGLAHGIWTEREDSLALITSKGNRAPGTNVNFTGFGSPVQSGSGQVAFYATLSSFNNKRGIWTERNGALTLVAREGNEAPSTNGGSFSYLSWPWINGAGKVAFVGLLTGEGIDPRNGSGIWSEGSGSLALVARAGSKAPGTELNFSDFRYAFLNSAGQTAFVAFLSEGSEVNNEIGIWSEGGGSLALVARDGNEAPGTNARFAGVGISLVLNGAGQAAFAGVLTGPDVDGSNDRGIWAQDPSGVLQLIAREGELLKIENGAISDFRTISSLSFVGNTGNEDGRASGFNDRGQLAFQATFTDGTSGIFVSNLVAIPEPASAMLFFTALAMCGARRRMR